MCLRVCCGFGCVFDCVFVCVFVWLLLCLKSLFVCLFVFMIVPLFVCVCLDVVVWSCMRMVVCLFNCTVVLGPCVCLCVYLFFRSFACL